MKKMTSEQQGLAASFSKTAVFMDDDKNIVPFQRALKIFDDLADQPDIAFGFVRNGCHARAHLMCRRIEASGINPKKIWAFEDGGDYSAGLYVTMAGGEKIEWCWHVAVALPVRMPDRSMQNLVFDPSLFDGPVTVQEWGKLMHANPENIQITPLGTAPKGYAGHYSPYNPYIDPDTHAKETMDKYLGWEDPMPRVVFQTKLREKFCKAAHIRHPDKGETWVSVERNSAAAGKEKAPALKT